MVSQHQAKLVLVFIMLGLAMVLKCVGVFIKNPTILAVQVSRLHSIIHSIVFR